jgi:siroheme synthase-like protein
VIVFACTGERDIDDAVSADAAETGALVNVVDRPEASAFYSAATVRRGPVVVAVGTAGASPTLARMVRDRVASALPPEVGALGDVLGRVRPRLLAKYPDMNMRARLLEGFVERCLTGQAGQASVDDIERAVEAELLADDAQESRCT